MHRVLMWSKLMALEIVKKKKTTLNIEKHMHCVILHKYYLCYDHDCLQVQPLWWSINCLCFFCPYFPFVIKRGANSDALMWLITSRTWHICGWLVWWGFQDYGLLSHTEAETVRSPPHLRLLFLVCWILCKYELCLCTYIIYTSQQILK